MTSQLISIARRCLSNQRYCLDLGGETYLRYLTLALAQTIIAQSASRVFTYHHAIRTCSAHAKRAGVSTPFLRSNRTMIARIPAEAYQLGQPIKEYKARPFNLKGGPIAAAIGL